MAATRASRATDSSLRLVSVVLLVLQAVVTPSLAAPSKDRVLLPEAPQAAIPSLVAHSLASSSKAALSQTLAPATVPLVTKHLKTFLVSVTS